MSLFRGTTFTCGWRTLAHHSPAIAYRLLSRLRNLTTRTQRVHETSQAEMLRHETIGHEIIWDLRGARTGSTSVAIRPADRVVHVSMEWLASPS